jgi:5-methylcytosine-specific restriction endonuclease McrA
LRIEIIESLLESYGPKEIAIGLQIPISRVRSRTAKAKSKRSVPTKPRSKSLKSRIAAFRARGAEAPDFTEADLLEALGPFPRCYLTDEPINLAHGNFHFDHIVPVAQGGSNGLSNLGLTTPQANLAKGAASLEDFRALAHRVSVCAFGC